MSFWIAIESCVARISCNFAISLRFEPVACLSTFSILLHIWSVVVSLLFFHYIVLDESLTELATELRDALLQHTGRVLSLSRVALIALIVEFSALTVRYEGLRQL